MMQNNILVIEDDPNILLGLRELLSSEGFAVQSCSRGDEALASIRANSPRLVILDVMLPGLSGFDICKQLRAENCSIPILMLTAKGQEIDKVIGLELGADDYVTKPFGLRELMARVHALLRRSGRNGNLSEANDRPFTIGSNTIDPKRYELRRGNNTLELSAKEMKLIQFFVAHSGEVLSRDRLLNEVWGYNYGGTTRTLDQVIVQLRKKLGEPDPPRHLLTVHGVGYKLVAQHAPTPQKT